MDRGIKFVAVSTVATTLVAVAGGVHAQTTDSNTNESAAAIRAEMKNLRQQMDQRMNALQQQLDALQQNESHATKSVQSSSANNASQNTEANNAAQSPTSGSGGSSSTTSAAEEVVKKTKIGGILELGYSDPFDTDEESARSARDTGGDIGFNKFSLTINGGIGHFIYSGDYRFYGYTNLLHYGWFGYKFSKNDNIRVGLIQAPFGNMPFGYLSYYGGLPYYLGYNDNQNVGAVYSHSGQWDLDLAFFKNSQLNENADHYGTNPVPGTDALGQDQENRAVNQGDVRVAYNFGKGTNYVTNVSLSGKGGEFYNGATHDAGTNWAAAAAINGTYGNLQAMLQVTAYKYNPDNPDGVSNKLVQLGSFATTYLVPAKGQLYQASLGYTIPIKWSILKSVTISDDYSLLNVGSGIDYALNSQTQDLADPQANDIGAYWDASPFFMWTDIVSGKNFLGFIGAPDNAWHNEAYVELGVSF